MRNKEIAVTISKNKREAMLKTYTNILYWIAMLGLVVYFAYTKGWIFANFESISAKQANRLLENDEKCNTFRCQNH